MYRAKRDGRDRISCDEPEPEASRNNGTAERHQSAEAAPA
jgi:hypothetical protein